MTWHRFLLRATIIALTGGLIATTTASADDQSPTPLGGPAQLTDGNVVQRWTVSGLHPSADAIPYPVAGTLWEATATDEAVQGSVTPVVSNFNARTADGQDYRVLFGVATPQGVNPATLPPGGTTTGKLYFDVTGAAPTQVVYNAVGHDLAVWRPASPAPATGPATRSAPSVAGPPTQQPPPAGPATPPAATAPAAGTPAPGSQPVSAGTPIAPGSTTPTPAPTSGSAGTPLPTASAGTPLPAGSTDAPAAGPTVTASPTPAAAGQNAGAPVTPSAPATPASTTPAPAPTP